MGLEKLRWKASYILEVVSHKLRTIFRCIYTFLSSAEKVTNTGLCGICPAATSLLLLVLDTLDEIIKSRFIRSLGISK